MRVLRYFMLSVLFMAFLVGVAHALSPAGTAERAAEDKALADMKKFHPAYTPLDAQMRSNRLSIAIPAKNRIGKRVDFKAPVRQVTRRNGSVYYEVGTPEFLQY